VAEFLRSADENMPEDFDDFSIAMVMIASKVISSSNGMSAFFLYESAKDVLRWHNLSVKKYINTIMSIGTLYHLDDEGWNKYKYKTTSKMLDGDDIDRLALMQQK